MKYTRNPTNTQKKQEILDKYIKEEEIKSSDIDEIKIKINITDEEDEDDEETNYSEKLENIMSGKYK